MAWTLPPSLSASTSFDLQRSTDPSMAAAQTIATALSASTAWSPVWNASTFLDSAATPPTGVTFYYSVRASLAAVWSPAVPAFSTSAAPTFASPSGTASPCGASTSPCALIQDALDATPSGGALILLPGVYSGLRNRGLSMAGKNIAVLAPAGPATTIQDCGGADRGWLFAGGESAAGGASLSGLTITNGRACSGGGLLFYNSSANVSNTVVTGCKADGGGAQPPGLSVVLAGGGAVFLSSSSANFDRVTLSANLAGYPGGGGAVYAERGSSGVFSNSLIQGNIISDLHGSKGGGMKLLTGASPTLVNCSLDGNQSPNGGLGGGMWVETAVTLLNVSITNNAAVFGGGIGCSIGCALSCTGCTFSGNSAQQDGGGFGAGLGTTGLISFTDSVFTNNSAGYWGGGLVMGVGQATVTLLRTSVASNTASLGAGIYVSGNGSSLTAVASSVSGNAAGADGGGAWCSDATLSLSSTNVSSNAAAATGGGIFSGVGCVLNLVSNSVVSGNSAAQTGGGLLAAPGSVSTLSSSTFFGNTAAGAGGGVAVPPDSTGAGAPSAQLQLLNMLFDSNVAAGDGGALSLLGGNSSAAGGTVQRNSARDGGGVLLGPAASLTLTGTSLLNNSAPSGLGGALSLSPTPAGTAPPQLTVRGGACGYNSALRGGCAALTGPGFDISGMQLSGNAAGAEGGGLYCTLDWSQPATRLNALSVTSNAAPAGSQVYWRRAASPQAALTCGNCTLGWLVPGSVATEPQSAAFSPSPPALAQTGQPIPAWSVNLLDLYGNLCVTAAGITCTVSAGAALPIAPLVPAVSSPATLAQAALAAQAGAGGSQLLLSQYSSAVVVNGSARFDQLSATGVVGLTYPLVLNCGTLIIATFAPSGVAAPPPSPPPPFSTSSAAALQLPPLRTNLSLALCPPGTEAASTLLSCTPCTATQFNLESGGMCLPCPVGALCPAPQDSLWAEQDYWRSENSSLILFACPFKGACDPGPATGDTACAAGYGGPVCAICTAGYYPWGFSCQKCMPSFAWVMPVAGVCAAIAFFALFALPTNSADVDPTVRVKVTMTFLQVLGLIKYYALQWRPAVLLSALSAFDILNVGLEAVAPSCGKNPVDFYSAFLTLMLLPVGVVGLCALVYSVVASYSRSRFGRAARMREIAAFGRVLLPVRGELDEAKVEASLDTFRTRCKKNAAWLVMLLYPGICKKIMQLYGTRTLEGGNTFLRADYTTNSRLAGSLDPRYSRYAAGGWFLVCFYPLGIPLFFTLAIRAELRKHARARSAALAKGEDVSLDSVWAAPEKHPKLTYTDQADGFENSWLAFLTAGYRSGFEYWEMLEMLRKLAMAAIAVFAVDGAFDSALTPDTTTSLSPVIQPLLGQLVTSAYLALFVWAKPFAQTRHNAAQVLCLCFTLLLVVAASVFNVGTSSGAISLSRQNGIGIALVTLLLGAMVGLVAWSGLAYLTQLTTMLPGLFPKIVQLSSQLKSSITRKINLRSFSGSAPGDVGMGVAFKAEMGDAEAPQADDAAHAEVLAGAAGGADRQPRVADGELHRPTTV